MKQIRLLWMLAAILTCGIMFTSCSKDDDNNAEQQAEKEFQEELDQAMAWAQVYGPTTQQLAEEVAARHNGKTTPLNYKTRESTERKCRTDNSRPFELKDLARTTVLCEYDSLLIVIDDVKTTATEQNIFGRYKHQTSDRGYWGDLFNLKFEYLVISMRQIPRTSAVPCWATRSTTSSIQKVGLSPDSHITIMKSSAQTPPAKPRANIIKSCA